MGWETYIKTESGKESHFLSNNFQLNFFEDWERSISFICLGERFRFVTANKPIESCDIEYLKDSVILSSLMIEVAAFVKNSDDNLYARYLADFDLILKICKESINNNENILIGIYH